MLLVLASSGCATLSRNYGTFVANEAVARGFQKYQVEPDTNYYYSGSELYPNVIMGLKKEYTLDNDLWKTLKPDSELFKKYIYNMEYLARDRNQLLYGFVMKSPDGRTLGIWYSPLNIKMSVKMGENNAVIVFTPDQHQGDENDESRGDGM